MRKLVDALLSKFLPMQAGLGGGGGGGAGQDSKGLTSTA